MPANPRAHSPEGAPRNICDTCGTPYTVPANYEKHPDCPGRAALPATGADDEGLAQMFHEAYERLAPSFGYETRKASAKPWSEVPENNRRLMTAVCAEIRAALAKRPAVDPTSAEPPDGDAATTCPICGNDRPHDHDEATKFDWSNRPWLVAARKTACTREAFERHITTVGGRDQHAPLRDFLERSMGDWDHRNARDLGGRYESRTMQWLWAMWQAGASEAFVAVRAHTPTAQALGRMWAGTDTPPAALASRRSVEGDEGLAPHQRDLLTKALDAAIASYDLRFGSVPWRPSMVEVRIHRTRAAEILAALASRPLPATASEPETGR